jgi:thioredoxin 1
VAIVKSLKIKIMNNFNNLINSEKPVLVDFFAEWCGPCKTMAPILKDVKKQLQDNATIIKIDVDKNPELASIYQIRSVPTLIMFKQGKPVWKQSGVVPTQELIKLFNQFQ